MAVVIDEVESTVEPEIAPSRGSEPGEKSAHAEKPAEDLGTELRRTTKRQMRLRAD